jgi:hypothetical protein
LTAENVLHANKMGGIAVPSLAVVKAESPLFNFGEITLLGSQKLIDPKGYAKTKVFGADIYSPRYPEIDYKLDKFALKNINEILGADNTNAIRSSDVQSIRDLTDSPAFKKYIKSKENLSWEQEKSLAAQILSDAGAIERIFKGYTDYGRKYVPHSLQNVVKTLKKELRGGESWNYGVGSVRAKFTPQFKSIAEIKKSADKLVNADTFAQVKKEIDDEFFTIANYVTDEGG